MNVAGLFAELLGDGIQGFAVVDLVEQVGGALALRIIGTLCDLVLQRRIIGLGIASVGSGGHGEVFLLDMLMLEHAVAFVGAATGGWGQAVVFAGHAVVAKLGVCVMRDASAFDQVFDAQ